MKIKPVFVGIAVIGALLLALSFNTLAKVWAASPRDLLTGVKTQPLATELLPQRSPLFLSFLVDPNKLSLFTQLAAKSSDRHEVRQEIANLKQQLKQTWLLDYEQDIQPWLDQEITLAITDTDLDHQPQNGLQTGYLLAFATKDVPLAKKSMDAFWQRLAINGSDIGFEQYQGNSILSTATEDQPSIAGTTLGRFVIFANDSRVIKAAINLQKDRDHSLAAPKLGDRLAQVNAGKIGIAYVNFAELDQNLPHESLLISFGLDKSGIRANTLLDREAIISESPEPPASEEPKPSSEPKSSIAVSSESQAISKTSLEIAKQIPSGSSVIIGNNLAKTLQDIYSSISPTIQKKLAQAIAPIPFTSDAVKGELFAWAQDEYAIALLPNRQITNRNQAYLNFPNQSQEWLIVAKVKDAQATKTAITALDNQVRNQLTVGEVPLQNQSATVWTKLTANHLNQPNSESVAGVVVAAHAQTNNYIYLSNSLAALENALRLKNNQAIANSQDFKKAIAKLPSDRQLYGYTSNPSELSASITGLLANLSDSALSESTTQIFNSSLTKKILEHTSTLSLANGQPNVQNGQLFVFFQ